MRRLITPLLLAAITAAMPGCQKTANQSRPIDPDLTHAAQAYFEQQWQHAPPAATNPNPRNTGPRTPDWTKARIVQLSKTEAVVVPVHYTHPFYIGGNIAGNRQYPIDQLAQLIVYKDSARAFHAEMLTSLPDSNYKGGSGPGSSFTGMLLVEQWDGQPLARYLFDGHHTRVWNPAATANSGTRLKQSDALVETCYEFVGYNYPASNPSAGYSYTEDLGCTSSFFDELPGTALIDGTGYQTVSNSGPASGFQPLYAGDGGIVDGTKLSFAFDSLPAINLAQYFQCFTYIPDQGATYSVTLCTDIPVDNNSGALLSTSFSTGHTFIILTKTNGNLSLSQSFGFYPQSRVLSSLTYVPSKISDDGISSHEYDASITMSNVSQLDFQTIEHMATNLANSQEYNLYNYNCTNYALQVFNSVRVNNPITIPDWIGSYTGIDFGQTPNALYNTLVGMKTFAPGINNPSVSVGPKYAPASAGACN